MLKRSTSATASWDALSDIADLAVPKSQNREAFFEECKSGALDGVVAICDRSPASFELIGRFDQTLVEALPGSVRFICHTGAGYDSIDVAACTARSILVSNCPKAVDDATADTAMFLILAALRGFNNGILAIRNRSWQGLVPPPPLGHDPQGKTLGILGYGGIGQNLKVKAEAFGMRIIYHSRRRVERDVEAGAEYVTFDELLRQSDVLSLNLPLNVSQALELRQD
jgi:glyoxylate reductase